MSRPRLQKRVPSARPVGVFSLERHLLRFHKRSTKDGSGKCDAYQTHSDADVIFGIIFGIDAREKRLLDQCEGVGTGYSVKEVTVNDAEGNALTGFTYYATDTDDSLAPFSWYKKHVLYGAREARLPPAYIRRIELIHAVKDTDRNREKDELAIYC